MLTLIKEYRKQKNMTQEQLASLTGLTQGQVARIEQGKTDIGLDQLKVFAQALGVKPYELLPDDWQPEKLSDEEKAFVDLFRKTKESAVKPASETKAG